MELPFSTMPIHMPAHTPTLTILHLSFAGGTTATVLVLQEDTLHAAWVGDSKAVMCVR